MFSCFLTVAALVGLGCQACNFDGPTDATVELGTYDDTITTQISVPDQKITVDEADNTLGVPQKVNDAFKRNVGTDQDVDTYFQSNPLLLNITTDSKDSYGTKSNNQYKVTVLPGTDWVIGKNIFNSLCGNKPAPTERPAGRKRRSAVFYVKKVKKNKKTSAKQHKGFTKSFKNFTQ
ncbi:unnamed protein product [Bursaphelenchus okinawaensis]|uniref:Uncharacterized protein n=1 Tax=Bursaphelenchus okinawaensis TaxID=465554 RepID=A0A811KF28_9BILA|nr:unnamed protein product [Bursaphelenchus okinawaensis]CAG9100889.1 unnamed protein product [Bursaphelenchus okinawaensis]